MSCSCFQATSLSEWPIIWLFQLIGMSNSDLKLKVRRDEACISTDTCFQQDPATTKQVLSSVELAETSVPIPFHGRRECHCWQSSSGSNHSDIAESRIFWSPSPHSILSLYRSYLFHHFSDQRSKTLALSPTLWCQRCLLYQRSFWFGSSQEKSPWISHRYCWSDQHHITNFWGVRTQVPRDWTRIWNSVL